MNAYSVILRPRELAKKSELKKKENAVTQLISVTAQLTVYPAAWGGGGRIGPGPL